MIKRKALELKHGLMEENMKDNEKITKWKEKEYLHEVMAYVILVNIM